MEQVATLPLVNKELQSYRYILVWRLFSVAFFGGIPFGTCVSLFSTLLTLPAYHAAYIPHIYNPQLIYCEV